MKRVKQRVRCFIHRLISPMHQTLMQVWCISEINRWIKQRTQTAFLRCFLTEDWVLVSWNT